MESDVQRRAFFATAATGLLAWLGCPESDPPTRLEPTLGPRPLALTGGRIIDGAGSPPISGATLVAAEGRIVAAGPSASVAIPAGADVFDASGTTLLPGFINAHVHGAYDAATLRAWAYQGVTTVRDLGADPHRPLLAMRDEFQQDPTCARLVAAGPFVTVPGGYPRVPWGSSFGLAVTSPDDARAKVNRLLDEGADVIKIAVESGASFSRTIPTLSPEEIAAITEVAHSRGTRVSAHVLVEADLERAVAGGADDIAHMVSDSLSDELIATMIARGVLWVPTLELWHGVSGHLGDRAVAFLKRFVQAGGPVALGTDYAGYSSHFDLGMPVREITWMSEAGMAAMEIIVAATRHAAEACNLGSSLGTLAPGRIADVLVVDGDPLADLGALARPRMVIRGGVVIRS
jgi:imidazolonepropionase-like amidohydrolase